MIVYLDLQVWIARPEEKKREEKKTERLPTTIMRCEQITQMETDAYLSSENVTFLYWRNYAGACRYNIVATCVCFRFFWFYLNFLLTRMTASVASTHHANVQKNSMRSWRWKEHDRHTLHTSTVDLLDLMKGSDVLSALPSEGVQTFRVACRSLLGAAGTALQQRNNIWSNIHQSVPH